MTNRITKKRAPYRYGEFVERLSLAVAVVSNPRQHLNKLRLLKALRASLSYSALEKIGLLTSIARMTQKQLDTVVSLPEAEAEQVYVIAIFEPEAVRDREIGAARDWMHVLHVLGPHDQVS